MAVAVLERERERELIRSTLVKYARQRITYRYGEGKKREKERVPREGNSHYAFEMVGNVPNETTLNLSPL